MGLDCVCVYVCAWPFLSFFFPFYCADAMVDLSHHEVLGRGSGGEFGSRGHYYPYIVGMEYYHHVNEGYIVRLSATAQCVDRASAKLDGGRDPWMSWVQMLRPWSHDVT